MKGETTIQLFDANTGKLTDEVTKHNLVTGAANDFLQILAYASTFNVNDFSISSLLNNTSDNTHDTIRELYGGVLVFSEAIDESHKYPIGNEILSNIGHAGQTASFYDSEDTYAGQFNAVESEFNVENKRYKFVWDFPTSACNGDIASICLTNKMVGDRGLLHNSNKLISNDDNNSKSIYNITPDTGYDRYYTYNGYLRNAEFNPKKGIGLDGNTSYTNKSYSSIIPDFNTITSGYKSFLYNYGEYRYLAMKYNNSSNILDLRLIKKDGTYDDYTYDFTNFKSMLSTESLSLITGGYFINHIANTFSLSDMCFYIICMYNNSKCWIAKFNITDGTFKFLKLEETFVYIPILFRYMDIPFCVVNYNYGSHSHINSSTSKVINDDLSLGDKCIVLPKNSYYINSGYSALCYGSSSAYNCTFSHSDDYSYNFFGYCAHPNACYLATINNQSDVLTKTPDKTMKIIYTLSE